ncbi:MAG: dephospho-CoA kinase [Crocinitomicaceae bacterium]|nr:dephospho-CoA kinase [Crocinitomicaceae bacterium]
MKKIGLTGGIGSGKTFIANILEKMGYPVFYSDKRAKELSNQHPEIQEKLKGIFGNEIYVNGTLNVTFLSNKIFTSPDLRETVNSIIHPVVRNDFNKWTEGYSNHSLVFNEAAILFETKAFKNFDANILVYAPQDIKIQRLLQRDEVSKETILTKMNTQWGDSKKMSLTRHHILNDGKTPILNQIEEILIRLNQ